MGCLLELIFEVIFEIVIEVILTIYMKLMSLIVPKKHVSDSLRQKIKNGVTIFAVLLFLCSLFGFFMFLQPPSVTKTVGAYRLFVPLGIMGAQIVAGIVYRIIKAIKSKH